MKIPGNRGRNPFKILERIPGALSEKGIPVKTPWKCFIEIKPTNAIPLCYSLTLLSFESSSVDVLKSFFRELFVDIGRFENISIRSRQVHRNGVSS